MSYRAARGRQDRSSLNGMIFLSLLLHAAVLVLLFLSPSLPSPKLTFGPVYTVSLVSSPGAVLEQRKSSTSSAMMKELMTAQRSEMVLKKEVEPSQAIPIRSLETKKKQQEPDIEKALDEIRKRAAASGAAPQPQAKAGPARTEQTEKTDKVAEKTQRGGRAASSTPGDAEMDAQMRSYYAAIWTRIKGEWTIPQGILPGEVLETVIDVTILRSGAVTDAKFEKRSGNRFFDDSTLKAVRKASPLPPLPAWIGDSSIAVGIRFHSSQMNK